MFDWFKLDPTGLLKFIKSYNETKFARESLQYQILKRDEALEKGKVEEAAIHDWAAKEIEKIMYPETMDVIRNAPKGTSITGPVTTKCPK